ncbi:protein SODIUM POTASSIUM ROOT DEFECTIVE 2 [Sesamum indicum]|uniref:Protein SODIUM POTASSIUM ROOT DEFECTIVE 2 n=1 Tax=Sesamum indicum TaxID=4182 RepID=A0A6I9T1T0_SESIN|nr:protein SODIUM POTASSIUM ROOT DEFECTIVE 2 [Sesamum indicum]
MKGIHIFCASQAATAICLTMDQPSSSSSTLPLGSSPIIDRYNPIITDSTRIARLVPPCTLNSHPKPHKLHHKKKNKRISLKEKHEDQANNSGTANTSSFDQKLKNSNGITTTRKSWSCNKPGDFISPPGSTRYLLREKVLLNAFSDSDPAGKLFLEDTSKSKDAITEEICNVKPPASSSPSHPHQVVVLRVSLHCRGCERKMRKHLSRMEGVTSFNIDFAAKKVTVTGNVTPLGVLSSISKVKNAQLWSPAMSSQIPPSLKNEYRGAGI